MELILHNRLVLDPAESRSKPGPKSFHITVAIQCEQVPTLLRSSDVAEISRQAGWNPLFQGAQGITYTITNEHHNTGRFCFPLFYCLLATDLMVRVELPSELEFWETFPTCNGLNVALSHPKHQNVINVLACRRGTLIPNGDPDKEDD